MRYLITVLDKAYEPTRLTDTPWAHFGHNRLYICPQCATVWAKWALENIDPLSLEGEWHPYRRSCPDHQLGYWRGDDPGSLLLDSADILVLPRPLLLRELFLNHHKEQDHEQEAA